jgi:hypothetical protein
MTGVPRELAEHALQILHGSKPVRQAMRRFGDKKCRAIAKEIFKLLKVGFVKEVINTKSFIALGGYREYIPSSLSTSSP